MASSFSRRTVIESALVVGGFFVLFVFLPHVLAGDDFTRYTDIEQLLHHGDLSRSPYSLVMPLASAPFLLLGEVVRTPEWWAAHFNVIVVAGGSLLLFWILSDRVDKSFFRSVLLSVLFASLLTNRLRDYNAEVFTATLFVVGLVLVTIGRRALTGWAAIVLGVVNTPAALIGAAVVAVAEAIRTRRLRYLAIPLAAAVLIMGEAWLRRGGPLTTGYEDARGPGTVMPFSGKSGFSYPLLFGLLSILFSLGRGLVFFMPGLLLWFSGITRRLLKEYRYLVALMLLLVCGLVAVYAKWWAWYGGLTWGPRFFVFAVFPASVLVVVRIRHAHELSFLGNVLTLFVLTLSAWVGVSGAIADLSTLQLCVRDNAALEALCWYTPEFSSLWRPLIDFPVMTWKSAILAAYCALVFAYLSAPLFVSLVRTLRSWTESRTWATSWRM